MQDADDIRRQKRRCSRSVLAGVLLVAVALWASAHELAPMGLTTAVAVVGFVLVSYGVHVGWVLFYDSEPDGPAS
jgi:uncharacterized membrane protein YiaA